MADKVLVAFASKYGATAEIAEKVGDTLRKEGMQADVLQAGKVSDLTQYGGIIIGSAMYMGQWRKDAVNFLKKNESMLAGKPVWVFVSGPLEEGDAVELMKGWLYPTKLKPVIEAIKPRDIAVFHGKIVADKLNFFERLVLKMVKAEPGDYRDWNAIADWSKTIAADLKK